MNSLAVTFKCLGDSRGELPRSSLDVSERCRVGVCGRSGEGECGRDGGPPTKLACRVIGKVGLKLRLKEEERETDGRAGVAGCENV